MDLSVVSRAREKKEDDSWRQRAQKIAGGR